MSGAVRSGDRLSAKGVLRLRAQLSDRDLAILHQVAELRLMSTRQVQVVHFPLADHGNQGAATRAAQRVLKRLTDARLLARLERRIGGLRAGSAGFVVALGPVGRRLLFGGERRQRDHEPGLRYFDHTLAVAQLVVDLQRVAQGGAIDLLECEAEPRSWRGFGSGLDGGRVLRPDLFVSIGRGEYELRWFVEVDRATESLPVVQRKCRAYVDYYQAGVEQASHGVFPRVCWIVPDEERARTLGRAIARDRRLPEGLFVIATADSAVTALQERN